MSQLARKRRQTEVFSLSFLDCICCGFGAVLLIFLLTISKKGDVDQADVDLARERLRQIQVEVRRNQEDLDRLAAALAQARQDLTDAERRVEEDRTRISDRRRELLLMLQQTGALRDALQTLLGEKQALPTEAEPPPVPVPNIDRRQYLTGVKLHGEFVVFVLRASGSMLDDTIDGAAARLLDADDKKREAPKWRKVIEALTWMLASLEPGTRFQILVFNEETVPLLPGRGEEWFNPQDRETMTQILTRLNALVPKGPANLERAFSTLRTLPRLPDSVVLLTDGLPTRSDSLALEGDIDEASRVRFFEIAARQLPPRVPVSTILFPLLTGDPGAPGLFWELANATKGALVSPAKSWPDT